MISIIPFKIEMRLYEQLEKWERNLADQYINVLWSDEESETEHLLTDKDRKAFIRDITRNYFFWFLEDETNMFNTEISVAYAPAEAVIRREELIKAKEQKREEKRLHKLYIEELYKGGK